MASFEGKSLFGDVGRTLTINEIVLSETIYVPGTTLPEHSHAFSYLCLVLQGEYTETHGSIKHRCTPSTIVFHSAKEIHADSFGNNGGRCFNIQVSPSFAHRMSEVSLIPSGPIHAQDFQLANLGARIYKEFSDPDEVSPILIEAHVMEMVARMWRRDCGKRDINKPSWLKHTREFLHSNFMKSLELRQIAALVGRHPVHVAREFRAHYNTSIGEYIRQLRVDYSIRQLCMTDSSLTEIALSAGFAHQSHFSRVFKLHTGMTPAAYRKFHRSR